MGKVKSGIITFILLAFILMGGFLMYQSSKVDELPIYVDSIITIEEEEPPLDSKPKVVTKTSKKTTKKNVKLKKASNKTYSKKLPTKKEVKSKTSTNKTQKITTKTTTVTNTTEKYTKKSKVKIVSTTVTTTVVTTTTKLQAQKKETKKKEKYEVSISNIASKANKEVLSAYNELNFKVYIDSSVSYSGYFNAKDRCIILKEEDDTIYHELGHFLAFVAGNADKTSDFANIYNTERQKYSGINKSYVTQNASEYFAESYRDFILNKESLKKIRPKTYATVENSVAKLTGLQIFKIKAVLSKI